jgi:hypothetical protein
MIESPCSLPVRQGIGPLVFAFRFAELASRRNRSGRLGMSTHCISHKTNSSTTWNKEVTDGYASICTERFIRQD